jgi:two-component system response regulator RegA
MASGSGRSWQPDLAVIDLKLADGSGLEVLDLLQARLPGCRSLVLTGFSSIATAVEAIKRGASNYLPKPAHADDILSALAVGTVSEVPIADAPLSVERLEWEHIQRILLEQRGNISATARALNMHRRTLQRKLQKKPARD